MCNCKIIDIFALPYIKPVVELKRYYMIKHIDCDLQENELVKLLSKGDEEAFNRIYFRYNKMLYVLAYRYIKDIYQAEGIVQQCFMKLWESRSFLEENMNIKNYLYTMVKNMVLNRIRDNLSAMEKNYETIQERDEFEDNIQNILEAKNLMTHFNSILQSLPEQKRIVCKLKIIENLSNQEIAVKLGISVPTVKTHYSQGIKIIRDRIQKLLVVLFFLLS